MSELGSRRHGALTPALAALCTAVQSLTGATGCRILTADGACAARTGAPPAGPARGLPLMAGDRELGRLEFWGRADASARELEAVAHLAALALADSSKANLCGADAAAPIFAAIGRFVPAVSLADAADQLLEAVRRTLGVPAAALVLDDPDGAGRAIFREGLAPPADPLPPAARRTLAVGRPWSGAPAGAMAGTGLTALIAAPLSLGPPLAGAILALRAGPAFTIDECRLLAGLASGCGLLLAAGHRAERVRDLAAVDPVDMLGDANYFRLRLAQEIGRADRGAGALAVVILAPDRSGPGSAPAVAERVRRDVRASDVVCRLGEHHLALVLPDLSGMLAMLVAERIRARLAAAGGTVSAGVAGYPDAGTSAAELAGAARRALGWAREHGADRSFLYVPAVAATLESERRAHEEQTAVAAAALDALAAAVDLRLGNRHSSAVARLCELIGAQMGLAPERIAGLRRAGVAHDVGMLGLPEALLTWPGSLSESDLDQIRAHPQIGCRLLAEAGLEVEPAFILHHHERVDGAGYPAGLRGEEIPLEARIIAVAEAFDAITADRPYRAARPTGDALAELWGHAGTQFDASVVAALAALAQRGFVGVRGR